MTGKKTYKPPKTGQAPPKMKEIMAKVYSKCREYYPGEIPEHKMRCARVSWSAAKKAGYEKVRRGKWIKR
jgi:hypothetical protein